MTSHFSLLLPIVLLSAIGTAARAENPAGACHLLSQAEVEQAVHFPSDNGSIRVNSGALTSCTFRAEGGGSVSVLLRRDAPRRWVAEQQRRMTAGSNFRAIDGVGDSAFVLDLRQAGAALCVFRGDYYLEISVVRLGGANSVLPATQELALKALSRLEGQSYAAQAKRSIP
jgi:hypothetical protein